MAEAGDGADERDRTADLLITNQLLYQLSYVGLPPRVYQRVRDFPGHEPCKAEICGLLPQPLIDAPDRRRLIDSA